MSTYNGWTNRETWLVNVWYSPTYKHEVDDIKELLEEEWDNLPAGILRDMCALDEVNWNELRDACEDEEDE